VQHSVPPGPEISVPGANGERKLDAFVFFRAFGKDNIKYIKLRSFDYKIDCKKPYAIFFQPLRSSERVVITGFGWVEG
jgi:hypothetical protein